jgi:hypothetical protein
MRQNQQSQQDGKLAQRKLEQQHVDRQQEEERILGQQEQQ